MAPRPAADERRHGIGELAREFDVTTRTIRFYEDEGLLAPERRGQAGLYSPRERVRLELILRGKRLGFSLAEIKEVLALYDAAPGEAGQRSHFLGKIAGRRRQLEQQRGDVAPTLAELGSVEAHCQARLAELEGRRKPAARSAKGW